MNTYLFVAFVSPYGILLDNRYNSYMVRVIGKQRDKYIAATKNVFDALAIGSQTKVIETVQYETDEEAILEFSLKYNTELLKVDVPEFIKLQKQYNRKKAKLSDKLGGK